MLKEALEEQPVTQILKMGPAEDAEKRPATFPTASALAIVSEDAD